MASIKREIGYHTIIIINIYSFIHLSFSIENNFSLLPWLSVPGMET